MLLQTQAKITKHSSLLERDEAEDYLDGESEEDDGSEEDEEQAMVEADQWGGGFNRCPSPDGAHSKCQHVGGGRNFAASARLCAIAAQNFPEPVDTFQFIRRGARCWLKRCGNVNIKYSTQGKARNWQIYSKFCGLQRVHTEVASTCPGGPGEQGQFYTNYLVYPRPQPDVCGRALKFNHIKANNLNGFGPAQGAETFRFGNVLTGVDLVVKADERYQPGNPQMNGVFRNQFGRLNMLSGTETTLTFRFVENSGQRPVKVDRFLFTVFDIDHGARCTSRMQVTATKYAAYYVDPDTELIVHTEVGDDKNPPSSTFTSSQRGTGKDNPKFPRRLNPTQKARTVTFEYQNIKFFNMNFKLGAGTGGRNILFGGLSSLTEDACPFDGHPNRNPAN